VKRFLNNKKDYFYWGITVHVFVYRIHGYETTRKGRKGNAQKGERFKGCKISKGSKRKQEQQMVEQSSGELYRESGLFIQVFKCLYKARHAPFPIYVNLNSISDTQNYKRK
jgi:hypothetical protein